MIVFKNYLKVAKSYLGIIILYTVIFLTIAIITTTSGSDTGTTFTSSKASIAVINEGEDTLFIDTFKNYIEESAELVTLENDEESLKDALFFRKVDYIMIIPEGYTEDFLQGNNPTINVLSVPDSVAAIYSKQLMNQYLNLANLYVTADIPIEDFASKLTEDLSNEATVTLANNTTTDEAYIVASYYSFANYVFMAITLTIVSMIMNIFNEDKIKHRNLVSGMSYQSINRQLLLGNLIFSIAIWLFYVIISCVLYPTTMLSNTGLMFVGNSFVFMTTVLALSFLITSITSNRNVIGSISNVLSLGSSFIAGSFVPQYLLSDFVLTIGKVFPSYWYVKNNEVIISSSFESYLANLGILLMFTVGIIICSQVISKFRLRK